MTYDKLPIVFLSTIASEKKGSIDSQIASYILNHLEEVQNMGIEDMANECHVAISSISRFCKEIGLRDYAELLELLLNTNLSFQSLKDQNSHPYQLQFIVGLLLKSIQESTSDVFSF